MSEPPLNQEAAQDEPQCRRQSVNRFRNTLSGAKVLKPESATMEFVLWSFKGFCYDMYDVTSKGKLDGMRQTLLRGAPKVQSDINWGDDFEAAKLLCKESLRARVKERSEVDEEQLAEAMRELEMVKEDTAPVEVEAHLHRIHQLLNEPLEQKSPYYNYVRIKNGYFFLVSLCLSFSIFSGILTESIVGAFTEQFENSSWVVILVPFMMMFFASLVEHLYHLALDAVDTPPFTRFQSTMLAVCNPDPVTPPPPWACNLVDLGMFIFELWPALVGIWGIFAHKDDPDGRGVLGAFLNSYVWGGLAACMMAATLYLVAQVYIHALTGSDLKIENVGDGHESICMYQKVLDKQEVFPVNPFVNWIRCGFPWEQSGISRVQDSAFKFHLVKEHLTGLVDVRLRAVEKLTQREKQCLAASLMIWVLLCILLQIHDVKTCHLWLVGDFRTLLVIGLALVVFICSYHFIKKLPDISGIACLGVLITYFVIFAGLVLATGSDVKLARTPVIPTMLMEWNVTAADAHGDLPLFWNVKQGPQQYNFCHRYWGSVESRLSAVDLGQLASIVYEPNNTNIPLLLNQTFNGKDTPRVVLEDVNDYDDFPRYAIFNFPAPQPWRGKGVGTRVIAVKGTSTKVDAFADMVLWSAIRVLQTFQYYVPVLSVLPVAQIQWMIQKFHVPGQIAMEQKIFESLEEIVTKQAQKNDSILVLTGHSLGGGLAQAIAAKTHQNALVWSAPGFEFSTLRFNLEDKARKNAVMQASQRLITNVMPKNDIVPLVDRQSGAVQDIECRDIDGNQGSAIICHKVLKSICEIWRVCGDVQNRSFAKACSPYIKRASLQEYYDLDDVSNN